MARWDAATIAAEMGARVEGDASAPVFAITTDSRTAREGDAFFALDGAQVRGRDFVPNAFGSGCSVVVVDESWTGEIPQGAAVLRVDDPLAALGRLASRARDTWTCPVLAVTGSAGKTTVKEMTAHILESAGPVFKSPGNFNTLEGLSRAILALETPPRVAVLEAGASKPGEIARLAALARPTAAAITNIAAAHLEGFGTLNDVAREKGDLLRAVAKGGLAIVNGDDAYLLDVVAKLDCRVLRVGFGPANDWRVVHREITPEGGSRFTLGDGREGTLAVPGEHQLRNALTALALAEDAGVTVDAGLARLAAFGPVAGRLVVREKGGVTILDDTYNANPSSMRAALAVLAERSAGRKAVVLGDMLELGAESRTYHADLGRSVGDLAPDLAVFVGDESRAAFEEAAGRSGDTQTIRHAVDSNVAARILEAWIQPGDAILVKGSRGMKMERVVRALIPGEEPPHAV